MGEEMKFDNEAGKNVKAFGEFVKETIKTEGTKIKIRQRQVTNRALRRMSSGGANVLQHSAGMASGVSRKMGK